MVKTNKRILRGILMLTYVLIISILLFLISSMYSFLNTGADRSKMLQTEVKNGQLIILKDTDVVEYKKVFKDTQLILETTEKATYRYVLLLEDGFWRIRHMVKEASENYKTESVKTPIAYTAIKGINYYPQATPWNMYGEAFDIHIIEKDFKLIK